MFNQADAKPVQQFQRLSERIAEIVANGFAQGSLQSSVETYARNRVNVVEETEYGIEKKNWTPEFYTKTSWLQASRFVSEQAKEVEEYKSASLLLSESALNPDHISALLEQFSYRIAYRFLETEDPLQRREYLDSLLSVVLKHVNSELLTYSSEVKLKGVVAPIGGAEFNINGTKISCNYSAA